MYMLNRNSRFSLTVLPATHETRDKPKPNSKEKLCYSDIYSDSEDEREICGNRNQILNNDDIVNGNWVAVIYDNKWYPGKHY